MKAIVALLAFVACASAGVLGPPAILHAHAPAIAIAAPVPVVKHVAPAIYAVPPPIVVSKAIYEPAPVVKVLHSPAPIVKTVSFAPVAYGLHHHDLHHHHHHHGHFF